MNRQESLRKLGQLIKESRRAAGVKQDDLQPIHRTALSKYENGRRRPPRGDLFTLCQCLNIDLRTAFTLAGYTLRRSDERPANEGPSDLVQARKEFEQLHRQMESIFARGESPSLQLQDRLASIAIQTNEEDLLDRMGAAVPTPSELYLLAERAKLLEPQFKGKIAFWYELAARTTNPLSRRYPAAVATLGTISMAMGDFAQAETNFRRAGEYALRHDDIMMTKQMDLHAMVARYRQGLDIPEIATWPRYDYDSSARWRSYWWVVTHTDWDRQDWDALGDHLRQARASFRDTWNDALELQLLGPEAAMQAALGYENKALEALQAELSMVHRVSEWGAHLDSDLWWDYAQARAPYDPADATAYWAVRVQHWHNQGCTGWVRHALRCRPPTMDWSATSRALRVAMRDVFNYYADAVQATAAAPGWVPADF